MKRMRKIWVLEEDAMMLKKQAAEKGCKMYEEFTNRVRKESDNEKEKLSYKFRL